MAWVIDQDYMLDEGLPSRVGLGYRTAQVEREPHTEFKLYDDDGELYYVGRITLTWLQGDERKAFAPLDWGRRDAGCTRMDYLDPLTKDWRTL